MYASKSSVDTKTYNYIDMCAQVMSNAVTPADFFTITIILLYKSRFRVSQLLFFRKIFEFSKIVLIITISQLYYFHCESLFQFFGKKSLKNYLWPNNPIKLEISWNYRF